MNYYIDVEQIKEIAEGKSCIDLLVGGMVGNRIYLTKQKTGYGEKIFLKCPQCGSRRTQLYFDKGIYICRDCFPKNIYRSIQNSTKGGRKYIVYKMERFAESRGIKIKRLPFSYWDCDRSKYKHEQEWVDDLTVLQALENMRFQTLAIDKLWSTKTIKSVLSWRNTLLYIYDLSEISDYMIDWDLGVDMKILNTKDDGIIR